MLISICMYFIFLFFRSWAFWTSFCGLQTCGSYTKKRPGFLDLLPKPMIKLLQVLEETLASFLDNALIYIVGLVIQKRNKTENRILYVSLYVKKMPIKKPPWNLRTHHLHLFHYYNTISKMSSNNLNFVCIGV